jgi:chemotaxis signal transduction protein
MDKARLFIDLAKILGGVVRDTIDVADYRITIMIERKIDDKIGIIVDSISVDKRMSAMDADIMGRRLKELAKK